MLTKSLTPVNFSQDQQGASLLEVLVTILILTFGLLGLAGLQSQVLVAELEAYQRAQAVLIMNDMVDRINVNRTNAASYVRTGSVGTGTVLSSVCPGTSIAEKDVCQWNNILLGASEKKGTTNVGGMVDGRGCIELVQAENATTAVCTPGIYRVTVAWQGSNKTSIPAVTCGTGQYGDERNRRAVSTQVSIGLPTCQ